MGRGKPPSIPYSQSAGHRGERPLHETSPSAAATIPSETVSKDTLTSRPMRMQRNVSCR